MPRALRHPGLRRLCFVAGLVLLSAVGSAAMKARTSTDAVGESVAQAQAAQAAGQYAAAPAAYATATSLDPSLPELWPFAACPPAVSAHALLGQIKADAGDLSGAIADLSLDLPSDSDGSLSFQLSRLYRREGQLALANQAEAHPIDLLASRRAYAVTAVEPHSTPRHDCDVMIVTS